MKDNPSHLHMLVCIFPEFVIFMSACSWILYTVYVFIRIYIKLCMRSEFIFHNNLETCALNSYSYYMSNVHSLSCSCLKLWPSIIRHNGTCKLIERYHSIYIYIIFSNSNPSENSLCNICMEDSNYVLFLVLWIGLLLSIIVL